jgi:beta-lactamase regulating signal transducer with metallopeptidase domain
MHSIWQAIIIAGILVIALIALRKKTSKIKYLATVLAMFTILSISITTFLYYYQTQNVVETNTDVAQYENSAGQTTAAEPISGNSNYKKTSPSFMVFKDYLQNHLTVFVTIWFLGIALFLIKLSGGFFYTHRIKSYQSKNMPVIWQNKMRHLCEKMKIKKSVRLLQSSIVRIPLVIGCLKPVILLPASLITGMPSDQLETIIIHELAHIYRRDYLVNILQSIIEILYFFHPAIWWISGIMRMEREHCCDDIVVRISNNSLNYAKALADIETFGMLPIRSAIALINNKDTLLKRIKRITQQPESSTNFSVGLFSTLLIVITIITVAFSAGNRNLSLQIQTEDARESSFLNFDNSSEWWYPIIKKHNIELRAFSNFTNVLEIGKSNRIDENKRITLDATIIINAGNDYLIVTSPKVVYTIGDSTYLFTDAELNRFSKNDQIPKNKEKLACKKLEIKLEKSIGGTPSFSITNLDKPQSTSGNYKWTPKKYSRHEPLKINSVKDYFTKKSLLRGEWQAENWTMGDSISTGNNITFKMWHGVELETNKLKFNKNTEIFETDLLKFLILKNKVIINFSKNVQGQHSFTANEIYREGKFIRLLGNASFSTDNTKIKANEIIIDQTE